MYKYDSLPNFNQAQALTVDVDDKLHRQFRYYFPHFKVYYNIYTIYNYIVSFLQSELATIRECFIMAYAT